jgi:hypothetical protein
MACAAATKLTRRGCDAGDVMPFLAVAFTSFCSLIILLHRMLGGMMRGQNVVNATQIRNEPFNAQPKESLCLSLTANRVIEHVYRSSLEWCWF